jgi:hypothetical protein
MVNGLWLSIILVLRLKKLQELNEEMMEQWHQQCHELNTLYRENPHLITDEVLKDRPFLEKEKQE